MRKILAIFSSLTLVSTGVFSTVLACKKTITPSINTNNNNNNKVTITNNSLNNIKTVSATLLKQIAIADYYGYNFEFLKSYFNNKNFFQQAKNYNINAEVKDNISLSTDFEDALENYFGKSLIIKKNENINLDGIKGTETDFLTSVLPKTLFGLTGEQISGAISLILENLSSAGIIGILDLGKNFDINSKFSDIINNLKISKDVITTLLNAIFSNPKFLEELNKEIETFDALTLYKDFELSELNNLAILNILDGVNGILDKDYSLVSAEVKPNNGLNVKLWETSKTFIKNIKKFDNKTSATITSISNNNQSIIPDSIKRHIKVAASLIRGLELFQYLFSLFDETRKEKFDISSDNIFNKSKKNTDFIKELYGLNNSNGSGSGKKISSLNNNGSSDSNSKTTLNLKYLMDTLNYYLGRVNKKENAYRLRQFAAILFSGKYIENKYKNENSTTSSGSGNSGTNAGQNYNSLFFEFNGSQNNTIKEIKLNGFQTFLVAILFESLSNINLKNLKFDNPIFSIAKTYIEKIDFKNFFESELFLKKGLADIFVSLLNLIIDSFISNKPIIDDNFVKVIENISIIILKNLKLEELLESLFKDSNGTVTFIKKILENFVKFDDISTKIDNFIKNEPTFSLVKSGIKSLIPILGENFFEYIYDKNVEQTFDTIATLTNDSVTKLVLEKFNIKIPAALNFIFPYFKKISISLRKIFPNNIHLNLQNLFSIKLSDFIKVDTYPNFGSYYLDKSITEILNEISNSDSSNSELKDLDKAYGFSIISLKNFIKGIFEYKYKWNNGKEDKKNLFSIILENPNKFKEVIGLTDDGMKENTNSLIDLLFNKLIPSDKEKNHDSLKWFAGPLNNVIINLNKKPNFTSSLEKHFSEQRFNKFEFSETKKENSGLIISQSISVTINDKKYAIIVRRDLNKSTFIVESIKKETIQNNI
ncbi:MOLPALP family lipoprotein [Mycoplasma capricolum subsp. capripneumoniae]|uniref:MOLPALP family lipoprotein n=1 Tax=Mycoplasma capricolum TaxID=2095 RepID=UPI0002EB9899|nr:MOLPALP family lipoprotein [Mycoplasma capricolum]AOQ22324.1 MOLPALP family lipoprotein [Mycoplasma capricolum subsp. capripneumoniae M1601]QIN43258.1 MOLPALP family lipoprotein [Mycoplasma capricolum subsp. capripneumoniae]QIN43939.1 MOLPALP family lipoprotein [Mycoplasma capricolum subsp. capripneumoniae]QIN44625.1 MOLPALP family lipoprotein [Mycoplasma capricolum subsp. capripneumoniae]QIN46682.1 MOLPALP family lipoprotein [Mycoplasma capricolum subsp. capripneumoniae]